mgnify:CR=1 FL=1
MKVELIRSVIGNYDNIVPIKNSEYDITTLNICSKKEASLFLGIDKNKLTQHNQLLSRQVKFSNFESPSNIRIWIDGNIYMENLDILIKDFIASDALIAIAKHPLRQSLKDELKACLMGKKIQIGHYKKINTYLDTFNDDQNNLCQSGVMLRKKSQKLDLCFKHIKNLLEMYAPRDQLFLLKNLNKQGIPIMLYDLEKFPIIISNHNVSIYERVIKKLNYHFFRIIFKLKLMP